MSNKLFLSIFPDSLVTKELVHNLSDKYDPELKMTISFDKLGISRNQIINKLVQEEVLPRNFHKL